MNFGYAIVALKHGERVYRQGWNGKGMWLTLIEAGQSVFLPPTVLAGVLPSDADFMCDAYAEVYKHSPYIAMKTVDDKIVPWLASQTDMLAEDWEIV